MFYDDYKPTDDVPPEAAHLIRQLAATVEALANNWHTVADVPALQQTLRTTKRALRGLHPASPHWLLPQSRQELRTLVALLPH